MFLGRGSRVWTHKDPCSCTVPGTSQGHQQQKASNATAERWGARARVCVCLWPRAFGGKLLGPIVLHKVTDVYTHASVRCAYTFCALLTHCYAVPGLHVHRYRVSALCLFRGSAVSAKCVHTPFWSFLVIPEYTCTAHRGEALGTPERESAELSIAN